MLTPELMLSLFQRLGHLQGGLLVRREILLIRYQTLTTRTMPILRVLIPAAEQTWVATVIIAETVGQLAKVGTTPHINSWDLL